jgi:hypothetical protein
VHTELETLNSKGEIQIEALRVSMAAFDQKISDALSQVTARISVCEQNFEQMKSRSEGEIETLRVTM